MYLTTKNKAYNEGIGKAGYVDQGKDFTRVKGKAIGKAYAIGRDMQQDGRKDGRTEGRNRKTL